MANMLDYLDWYGDFGFDAVPFNEVDNLILSQLAYMDLGGCVPGPDAGARGVTVPEAARRHAELHPPASPSDLGPLISPDTNTLLGRMATSGRRFADARLLAYEEKLDLAAHEQFGALCVGLPDGTTYVSFRGTGDELVGWLEDCEMSYKVVPSQEHAARYLGAAGELAEGPLRVGGHSKGGNLAAYAASRADKSLRGRVLELWCNDSPGFVDEVVPLATLEPLAPVARFYTPEFSVIGSLFQHVVRPAVIKSSNSGIMQHSGASWQVMRGNLVRGATTENGSARVREAFGRLIESHDLAGREKLLGSLYDAMTAQGINSASDMLSRGLAGVHATLASIGSLDDDDRQSMTAFLTGIVGATVSNAVAETVAPVARKVGDGLREAAKSIAARAEERAEVRAERLAAGRQDDAPAEDAADARPAPAQPGDLRQAAEG